MAKTPFMVKEGDLLWEYIGDLSQDILECSYNEDDIRQLWVNGRIDEEVQRTLGVYPWRLEGWRREDGRYSDLLTVLVIQYGGWSQHWGWVVPAVWTEEEWGKEGPPKPEVDPLTAIEQAIVAAFLLDNEIVVSS